MGFVLGCCLPQLSCRLHPRLLPPPFPRYRSLTNILHSTLNQSRFLELPNLRAISSANPSQNQRPAFPLDFLVGGLPIHNLDERT